MSRPSNPLGLAVAQLVTERDFVRDLICRIEDPELGWSAAWEAAHEMKRPADN